MRYSSSSGGSRRRLSYSDSGDAYHAAHAFSRLGSVRPLWLMKIIGIMVAGLRARGSLNP